MKAKRMTEELASVVKALLAKGLSQHRAAALVGVNGGRAAEIATGQRFADVPCADESLTKRIVQKVLDEYRLEIA